MIGFFGGTFDPVHFGHLNLAIQLKERGALEEVWVVPAQSSPLRAEVASVSGAHRFKMAQLAFDEIPGFKVLDIELKRPGPSYTIDTVKEFLKITPHLALLLGGDSLFRFMEWRNPEELISLVSLLIGERPRTTLKSLSFPPPIKEAILKGITSVPQLDISATEIRERLKKKLYCGHLIPAKVLDYIYENQLYFSV